ncbi:MAG: DUF3021 family protein [Bacillota bacterium]|nr:DUF3021 family protein [Bacillota bacterium]
MNRIKVFLHTYVCVVTGVLFATAFFITFFTPKEELDVSLLWQILFVSLLCSIGGLIYPEKSISGKKKALLVLMHYVEVNAVVLGFGIFFDWFSVEYLPHVIGMLLLINIIFLSVSLVEWKRAAKEARLMNGRLAEYQK